MERPRRINVATCSAGPILGVLSARATLVWVAIPETARALSAPAHLNPRNLAGDYRRRNR